MKMMPKKVLVVDDEPQIVKVLKAYLENGGYQVLTALDGKAALALFHQDTPDFVILDLNLPGMDGMEVCQMIRDESDVPILMLTARVQESDKLTGLDLGADDYVIKPFSPREVVARVRTILRRTKGEPDTQELIQVGDIRIDPIEHRVTVSGREVDLTPTEFDILTVLARQPKRVFSRLQIMELAQGSILEGYERSIDVHIKNIRIKLEEDPKNPVYIQTIFGVGYKLEGVKNA